MDNNNKPVLLFVDDSKVMRLAADKMLGREFRVEVAENGVEAWEMICHNPTISVVFFRPGDAGDGRLYVTEKNPHQ
jgi:CheY-like chemotaxis protein